MQNTVPSRGVMLNVSMPLICNAVVRASECISRGHRFESQLGHITFVHSNYFYGHSPPSIDSRRAVVSLILVKSMYTKYRAQLFKVNDVVS